MESSHFDDILKERRDGREEGYIEMERTKDQCVLNGRQMVREKKLVIESIA